MEILEMSYLYSRYGKYSDPFKMFTLFHCSHLLKSKKFILFLINVTRHPILIEKKIYILKKKN